MSVDQPVEIDSLLAHARELLLLHQNPSVGYLQRHLKIGYKRGQRLMQSLEGDVVTVQNDDGWRRMLLSGKMSPEDPQSPDYESRVALENGKNRA